MKNAKLFSFSFGAILIRPPTTELPWWGVRVNSWLKQNE